ncbi:PepSY domain-containing protein [Streptomyces sp. NPDC102462]|uniref:PepSY domain-containing protein n=1 Tax=Streptomyces sp. NPDC102462 TaxID=3366178 RepID=UPI0037FE9DDF
MKALKRHLPTGRRRTVTAVLAAAVLLGGAGAATGVAVADGDARDGGTRTGGSAVGAKQAADAAVTSVAGTVTAVEREEEHGRTVWKVDVVDSRGTGHEVTVDGGDRGVSATGTRADRGDRDDAAEAAAVRSAATDLGRALTAALAAVHGTVTSAEIDDAADGTAVWEIDVVDAGGTEHEVVVDAATGRVRAAPTDGHDRRASHRDDDRAGDDRAHDHGDDHGDDHDNSRDDG